MGPIANQNIAAVTIGDRVDPGLGPKNPTVGKDGRVALPRDAVESTVSTAQDKAGKRKKNSAPTPAVPPSAIRMAKVGGTIALIAAAAISAQTLVSLGHTIGLHGKIAWLLPASLDVYAATAIWVGYRIPSTHPAAAVARRDARLALSLTVCCNVLYHLLILAGSSLPKLLTDTLLLCVGALPPLVVERIFHLQMSVRNGDDGNEVVPDAAAERGSDGSGKGRVAAGAREATAATAATPTAPAAAATEPLPATGNEDGGSETPRAGNGDGNKLATVSSIDAAGRRSAADWAKLALPLWQQYTERHNGEAPTAPVLANLLRNAHPELPVPGSPRSERNIRAAVEELLDGADDESERAEAVS